MIKLSNLEKVYTGPGGERLKVLDIDRLEVSAGEKVALAGPSGSGKTTLINLITGLTTASNGEIWVNGEPIHKLSERARDDFRARTVGLLFQTFNLLPGFSALENVTLAMGFANKIKPDQRASRAKELLEQLGLKDRLKHRPAQLSTGQQQRVALARALANRPLLLIADEPTASVDHPTAQTILELLETLCRENGTTLLVASHDPLVLGRFERILRLNQGGQLAGQEVRQA